MNAEGRARPLPIDADGLLRTLLDLLAIPSPTGFTDDVVRYAGARLDTLGIPYVTTRRGTIRALLERNLPERRHASPACAVVAHLDTLGAMVRAVKPSGRLALAPVGTWSARWAEGGRVTVFADTGRLRGSVLPLLASGHVHGDDVDRQPVGWDQLEVRVDAWIRGAADARALGVQVGDFVAFDATPEVTRDGFVVARHLDNKAGVAALLAALQAIVEHGADIPMPCHAVFTLTEEVGSGARAVIEADVSEVVGVDIGPVGEGQGAREDAVTVPMMDSAGPHDLHLTRRLLALADAHGIPACRDVFRHYHSDASAAVNAGHDVRTALLCFGADASHGYERTHLRTLVHLAELLALYLQLGPTRPGDRDRLYASTADPRARRAPQPAGKSPPRDAAADARDPAADRPSITSPRRR